MRQHRTLTHRKDVHEKKMTCTLDGQITVPIRGIGCVSDCSAPATSRSTNGLDDEFVEAICMCFTFMSMIVAQSG